MPSSTFARQRHHEITTLLTHLVTHVAGVAPSDELGNHDIAVRWALDSFALHQARPVGWLLRIYISPQPRILCSRPMCFLVLLVFRPLTAHIDFFTDTGMYNVSSWTRTRWRSPRATQDSAGSSACTHRQARKQAGKAERCRHQRQRFKADSKPKCHQAAGPPTRGRLSDVSLQQ